MRNLIPASGFVCFASGAMEVTYGDRVRLSVHSVPGRWLAFIGAVVLSSVHSQDMYDQAGDGMRGRRTMPLVIEDWPSRLLIAVKNPFWSCLGLWLWQMSVLASIPCLILGAAVSARTTRLETVPDDWLVSLYSLPLIKYCNGSPA